MLHAWPLCRPPCALEAALCTYTLYCECILLQSATLPAACADLAKVDSSNEIRSHHHQAQQVTGWCEVQDKVHAHLVKHPISGPCQVSAAQASTAFLQRRNMQRARHCSVPQRRSAPSSPKPSEPCIHATTPKGHCTALSCTPDYTQEAQPLTATSARRFLGASVQRPGGCVEQLRIRTAAAPRQRIRPSHPLCYAAAGPGAAHRPRPARLTKRALGVAALPVWAVGWQPAS